MSIRRFTYLNNFFFISEIKKKYFLFRFFKPMDIFFKKRRVLQRINIKQSFLRKKLN